MTGSAGARASTPRAIIGIALLAVIAFALNRSGIDLVVSDFAFDEAARAFRWRDQPLLAGILHDGAKWVAVAMVVALLALLAATRRAELAAWRTAIICTLVGAIAATLAVSLLKSTSAHSCPWDLERYGGAAAYFPLLSQTPPHAGPGRCLPSGHASVGFMWIAAIYALRRSPLAPERRGVAQRRLAFAVIAFGTVVAAAQVLRGAHFVSHVVLTASICWLVAWALDRVCPARRYGTLSG